LFILFTTDLNGSMGTGTRHGYDTVTGTDTGHDNFLKVRTQRHGARLCL